MPKPTRESNNALQLTHWQNKALLIFLGMILVFRLFTIADFPLTDTTEARYAEIARKMVETNDWITPQFDYGVPFWGKPPLHTWLSAAGMKCFGINEFGARIFIFLIACGLLLMCYRWAKAVKGQAYALVGTAILASSGLFYVSMGAVMTDLVMAFGTTLGMIAFWNALHASHRSRLWGYLFFGSLSIGLLAKGPVAVVLTALPLGFWVMLTGQWSATWKKIPWITGSLLMLALSLPWYVAAEIKTPGFLEYFIIGEHIHRFTQSGWTGDLYGHGHAHARGSIWLYALMDLLPWTPFILAPLLNVKKSLVYFKESQNPWLYYLCCWAIAPMIFFTLATNILPTYAISGVPACCFLAIEVRCPRKEVNKIPSLGSVRFFTVSAVLSLVIFSSVLLTHNLKKDYLTRKSQIFLIQKARQLSKSSESQIFYWKKRYYSADFYSQGKAKVIGNNKQLLGILDDNKRDFLAVKVSYLESLPPTVRASFTRVGTFGKVVLFSENAKPLSH